MANPNMIHQPIFQFPCSKISGNMCVNSVAKRNAPEKESRYLKAFESVGTTQAAPEPIATLRSRTIQIMNPKVSAQ